MALIFPKFFLCIRSVPLEEALGYSLYPITTGGNASWFGQEENYYVGSSSAQSGDIDHNGESWMQTTVKGIGTVSFYWEISSENDYDFLTLYVDDQAIDEISGYQAYEQFSHNFFEDEEHTLKWVYTKDKSVSYGEDCGWVDQLEFEEKVYDLDVPLEEAVDNSDLTFTTGGDAGWFGQDADYYFGSSSARSGSIDHNGESWMQTTVTGKGTVSFYWKLSSEREKDNLQFYIDSKLKENYDSETSSDWVQVSYDILLGGEHTLKWKYTKDAEGSYGYDCGWVDQLEFEEKVYDLDVPLEEAVDNSDLTFTTGGDAGWFGQTLDSYSGSSSARSGSLDDNEESWMQTTVTGKGTVSFYWKLSSEREKDNLQFYIDSELKENYDSEIESDWVQVRYHIYEDGEHTLKWKYIKDAEGSYGEDCGWVDQILFDPDIPLEEALDNSDLTFTTVGNAGWFGQNHISHFGSSAARSGFIDQNEESGIQTTVTGQGTVTFSWKISSSYGDPLIFYIDGEEAYEIAGRIDWREQSYHITTEGEHTLEWVYTKNYDMSYGEDCGWVDQIFFDPDVPLEEALDNPDLNFTTGGNAIWFGQKNISHFGSSVARSGPCCSEKHESWMQTTVTGNGIFSFYWRSQSSNSVHLKFYIDEEIKFNIISSYDRHNEWEQLSFDIKEDYDTHTLKWVYLGTSTPSWETDCVLIEKVEFGVESEDNYNTSLANNISPITLTFLFFLFVFLL
ncbi:hypothetical protein M0812_00930 [Anaeramoeba flamelloides]|uniref:Uncharacterized protein n=1 Tax=Anaeramoeba flamelloides TaxID=1746091 RepID=A0AAV8A8W7_9EUKA|nr:hypothetical protein M0812_00930 [Anaeramoeba flamelloides]